MKLSLTPSSARFPFLRPILRNFGETGIDILLGTSAYIIFGLADSFLEHDDDETDNTATSGWEWIRLVGLHSFASRSSSESFEYGTGSSRSNQSTSKSRRVDSLSGPTPTRRSFGSKPSASLRDSANTVSYGSTLPRHTDDLINLDSEPTRRSHVGASLSEGRRSRSRATTQTHEYDASVDPSIIHYEGLSPASSRLAGKEEMDSSPDDDGQVRFWLVMHSLPILFIWAILLLSPLPYPVSLSSPISSQTPLSVACILPPSATAPPTWSDYIYHSQTVSGRSKLLVWPKDAIHRADRVELSEAVGAVHQDVAGKYGVWVIVGLTVGQKQPRSETIMVGPDGLMAGGSSSGSGELEESMGWEDEGSMWTLLLPP